MKCARLALLVLLLPAQPGCGTLFSGTRQTVQVSTDPVGANVALYRLDGEPLPLETRPGTADVVTSRPVDATPYLSVVSSPGRCPRYEITRVGSTPGAVAETFLLAIPFIQVIGFGALTFDNWTGGCCTVEPLVAVLEEDDSCR